jgi:5-methylthioadenosine/S-adenosylhomocysteine deaminase
MAKCGKFSLFGREPDLQIDALILPRWLIPVEPDGLVLERYALAVKDGRIADILPSEQARTVYTAAEILELPSHALIPGLVNAHTHSAMSLFRGLADDLPLKRWLNDHIWPAEGRWVSEAFVADGTRLALAEMLRGGTTCFNDMYFFPDVTARVSAETGVRAMVGLIVIDFPSAWADGPDAYLARGLQVHDQFRNHPLVHTAFAPHAPYSVSQGPLERIRTLADELEIPVHIHVHETREEVEESLKQWGKLPIQRLAELGLLTPGLMAVHMTQLTDAEIHMFAEAGAYVIHCPESNLKLANGFCPVARLAEAGVRLAIGTDGAASNNDLDMFGEMRTASLLAKGLEANAEAVPANAALRMATLDGALVMGISDETGSLEKGKSADMVAVELGGPESVPVFNPISQLVYATGRHQVTDVWVAGRRLLQERGLTTLDQEEILARANEWRDRIAAG